MIWLNYCRNNVVPINNILFKQLILLVIIVDNQDNYISLKERYHELWRRSDSGNYFHDSFSSMNLAAPTLYLK